MIEPKNQTFIFSQHPIVHFSSKNILENCKKYVKKEKCNRSKVSRNLPFLAAHFNLKKGTVFEYVPKLLNSLPPDRIIRQCYTRT